jgi:RNA polymerase sigma factor (sigma-70 family)
MTSRLNAVVQQLRRAGLLRGAGGLTDGELLECFVSRRDAAALEALVRRYAPMVWGVCRRVLRDHHEAEDAFQAAFLVLVRKAGSITPRERVGSWLYGVARQTALKARATAAKQRARERQGTDVPEPATKGPGPADDLSCALDEEMSRLPDKYRAAIVLCHLQGQTRKEAARQLGVPEGTLAARVARGRALLAKRLARRGLAVSGGALAGELFPPAAPASVPAGALSAAVNAVRLTAAGRAAGAVAARVATLTEGVLKAMVLNKARAALAIALVAAALLLGGVFGYHTLAADRPAPEPQKDRLADTLVLLDKQWWEAASQYDVDTLSKILADDWIGFDRGVSPAPDSPRWTKATSLENYRRWHFTEVKFVKDREVFRIDEHTALMIYEVKWRAEGKDGNSSSGQSRYTRCWVQRDGGWFVKHTECVNLPVTKDEPPPLLAPKPAGTPEPVWKRGVRASSFWQTEIPENAFDGKRDTDWNAGDYAPAWIERDLGACLRLAGIALFPCQDIAGPTTHEVWVSSEPIGNDRTKAKLVHTFKGETTNNSPLKFDFPKDLSARYVLVRTTQSPIWVAWWEVEVRVREGGQEKVIPLSPPDRPKQAEDDKAALQGTWQVLSVEAGGKDVTKPWQRNEEWVVKDGWITVRDRERQLSHNEVFAVRPEKSPKEIDINAYPVGVFVESDVVKGIYTLDGDVWKVCLRQMPLDGPPKDWAERPKEMRTKEGGTAVLITLKRTK